MGQCLKTNTTLEILDISANRITREGFSYILDGLTANKSLQILKASVILANSVLNFLIQLIMYYIQYFICYIFIININESKNYKLLI